MSAVLTELGSVGLFAADVSGYSPDNLLTLIPQGQIGGISIQATLEEIHHEQVEVTDHPVQAGAQITDHSFSRPSEVVLRCGWSNASTGALIAQATSLFSSLISGSQPTATDYVGSVYNQLLALMQQRQPITIVTTLRQYTSMLLIGLQVTRDAKTSQALMLTATCRQIITVDTTSSTLPPVANQAMPASTAETTQAGTQSLIGAGTVDIPGFYDEVDGGSSAYNSQSSAIAAGVS